MQQLSEVSIFSLTSFVFLENYIDAHWGLIVVKILESALKVNASLENIERLRRFNVKSASV